MAPKKEGEVEEQDIEQIEVKVGGQYLCRLTGEKMPSAVQIMAISKSKKFVCVAVMGKPERVWHERSKIDVYEEM